MDDAAHCKDVRGFAQDTCLARPHRARDDQQKFRVCSPCLIMPRAWIGCDGSNTQSARYLRRYCDTANVKILSQKRTSTCVTRKANEEASGVYYLKCDQRASVSCPSGQ